MAMPNSYKVRDYMKSDVATITKDATLKDAVKAMMEAGTNGLVVVDEYRKVCGIISSWDVIQHVVPDYLEEDKHLAPFEAGSVFASRVKEVAHDPVSKFMTKNVHTVTADDALMEAATLLSEFRIRQLPVVDKDSALVGYINRTDIKKAVNDILMQNLEG